MTERHAFDLHSAWCVRCGAGISDVVDGNRAALQFQRTHTGGLDGALDVARDLCPMLMPLCARGGDGQPLLKVCGSLRRLKKRRLALRDEIVQLELSLSDEPA